MEKPVIISIKSTQNMDGQEDTIELVTQGVLRHSEEEGFALVYPESRADRPGGDPHHLSHRPRPGSPSCGGGPSTPR